MKDLTKGNIYKHFLLFAFPLVLSGMLSTSFTFIDKAIVGRFLGEKALAAISAATPPLTFLSSVFWGYFTGCSIYVARLFGERNYSKIKSVIYTVFAVAVVAGAVLSVLLIVFRDPVFDMLKINDEIRGEAMKYYLIRTAALIVINLPVYGLSLMAAFGVSGFPFIVSVISTVIVCFGNIASVVWFGWGITGIAIFDVLSSAVGCGLYYWKLRRCFKQMGVDKERVKIKLIYFKESIPYLIPTTVQQAIMYIPDVAIAPIINGIGTQALAGYAVASTVMGICSTVYQNSTKVVGNYVSQCVGEKKFDKINKGAYVGLLQSTLFCLPFLLVGIFFAKPICSLFLEKGASETTKQYAYLFCQRYMPFILFSLVNNLAHALYRGSKASFHLVSCTCVGTAVKIVSAYSLQFMGVRGYYLAIVLSWVIEAVYAVALFFIGKWRPERKGSARSPVVQVEEPEKVAAAEEI